MKNKKSLEDHALPFIAFKAFTFDFLLSPVDFSRVAQILV